MCSGVHCYAHWRMHAWSTTLPWKTVCPCSVCCTWTWTGRTFGPTTPCLPRWARPAWAGLCSDTSTAIITTDSSLIVAGCVGVLLSLPLVPCLSSCSCCVRCEHPRRSVTHLYARKTTHTRSWAQARTPSTPASDSCTRTRSVWRWWCPGVFSCETRSALLFLPQVTVLGNAIYVYINSVLIISATDPSASYYDRGTVGFYSWNDGTTSYDDLVVTSGTCVCSEHLCLWCLV